MLLILLIALGVYAYLLWMGVSKPVLHEQAEQEEHAEEFYTLGVKYPELRGLRDAVVEASINAAIKKSIDDEVTEFVAGAKEIKKPPFPGAKSEFQIEYAVAQLTPSFRTGKEEMSPAILSLSLHSLPYYAGAAHPNGSVRSMNFDLRTGGQFALADLFTSGSDYFTPLVAYVRADLKKQFEPFSSKTIGLDDWIMTGTEPTAENYAVFLLRKDGLAFVFNPYQVAPYVFGERTVVVPWATLRAILAPAWQPVGV